MKRWSSTEGAGGKLGDMVQMTVFITDVRSVIASRKSAGKYSAITFRAAL
jgi:hypothetical protein